MNNITPKELTKAFDNPTLFSLVNSWINQKAYAEITREEVDKIQSAILDEIPFCADAHAARSDGHRITKGKDLYQSSDEASFQKYLALCDERERAAGIKPADMTFEFCPALVAETNLTDIEHAIWDVVLPILGIDKNSLFHYNAEKKEFVYETFNRLTISAVIAHPKFKPENYAESKSRLIKLNEENHG